MSVLVKYKSKKLPLGRHRSSLITMFFKNIYASANICDQNLWNLSTTNKSKMADWEEHSNHDLF